MFFRLGFIKGHKSLLNHHWGFQYRIYSEWMGRHTVVKVIGGHPWCLCLSISKGSDQQTGCIRSSPGVSCNIDIICVTHLIGGQLSPNTSLQILTGCDHRFMTAIRKVCYPQVLWSSLKASLPNSFIRYEWCWLFYSKCNLCQSW